MQLYHPFYWAVALNQKDDITALVNSEDDINKINIEQKEAPLHAAARLGLMDATKILLQHGANVNVSIDTKITPLHYALAYGNFDIARLLIENCAAVNATIMMDEILPHIEEIMPLGKGQTPLHLAIYWNRSDIVRCLLQKGANINALTAIGETP